MVTLEQISAMAMDLYYQNYRTDESFFDMPHFQFMVVQQYTDMFAKEALINKRENKSDTGYSYIEISPDWMITETHEVKYDKDSKQVYIETNVPPFVFKYDAMGSGIQYVTAHEAGCTDFKRIAATDKWMICRLPATEQALYYVEPGGKVVLVLNGGCKPKKINVQYVPSIDCTNPESIMREDLAMDIMKDVLNTMFGARQGVLVDMANNSNPNMVPQGEVDYNVNK